MHRGGFFVHGEKSSISLEYQIQSPAHHIWYSSSWNFSYYFCSPRWDTAGYEKYKEARYLNYFNTHIILVAFCFDCPDSLANVETFWVEDLKLDLLKNAPVSETHLYVNNFRTRNYLLDWRQIWRMMSKPSRIWQEWIRWNWIGKENTYWCSAEAKAVYLGSFEVEYISPLINDI